MKLKAFDKNTGKEVKIGDTIIDFRGDRAILTAITRVNELNYGGHRSGKICAAWENGDRREVYDKVFNLIVKYVEDSPYLEEYE